MSNLKLLQVGNRPFHVHGQTIFDNYKVTGKNKVESFIFSPYKTTTNLQWLNNPVSLTTKGVHMSIGADYNVDLVTQELREWIGKPTILIAYELFGLENNSLMGCACETKCEGDCDLTYLQTFGVLKGVDVVTSDPSQPNELSLNFDIFDFWRELDNYTWEWNGNNSNPLLKQSSFGVDGVNYIPENCENYFSKMPNCSQIFERCNTCMSFHYRDWDNENLYYDELFWYDQYNSSCSNRNGGDSAVGISSLNEWIFINSKKGRWNAPPLSVYSFSGLPDEGVLSINVVKNSGLTTASKSSTVDLSVLNTSLAADGYSGLEFTDRIIVGDIRRSANDGFYRPSFVERNGVVLETKPLWNYSEWFPGMLGTDYSKLAFDYSGNGDIINFNAAYIHHFRRI